MPRAVVLHKDDNVGTLIDSARKGEACTLQGERTGSVPLAADIAFGHKVCIAATPAGGDILKYGQVIGRATKAIAAGASAVQMVSASAFLTLGALSFVYWWKVTITCE